MQVEAKRSKVGMLLLKRTGERGERRPKMGLVLGSRQELKVIFGQLGLEYTS